MQKIIELVSGAVVVTEQGSFTRSRLFIFGLLVEFENIVYLCFVFGLLLEGLFDAFFSSESGGPWFLGYTFGLGQIDGFIFLLIGFSAFRDFVSFALARFVIVAQLLLHVELYLPYLLRFQLSQVEVERARAYLLEGFLLDYLENAHPFLLGEGADEFCNVKYLFLIVVLLVSLLLPVVVVAGLLDLRDFPGDLIDAFLDIVEAIFKLQFSGLFDVEEKLVDEFVDHAEGGLFEGDVFEVLEDEHHAVLEGVDRVDVLLVLRFDLQEGAHEAHPLQVARQLRVPVVPPESL